MDQSAREPFNISRVLKNAVGLVRENPALFLGLTGLFVLAPQALGGLLISSGVLGSAGTFNSILNLPLGVISLIGNLAMTWAALAIMGGKSVSIGQSVQKGGRYFWPAVGISILSSLGIGLGLVLLIVPGLILATMWCVALPAYIDRDNGVSEALSRSAALTKGSRWPIFAIIIVLWIAYLVPLFLIGLLAAIIPGTDYLLDVVILPLAISAMTLAGGVGYPAIYRELRYRGGGTTDQTAEVFA